MTSRVLLDGFPLYLLLPMSSGSGTTLVFHDSRFRSLDFISNLRRQGRVFVIASPKSSQTDRERLRREYSSCHAEVLFTEIVDLPFAPNSIAEIIVLRRTHQAVGALYEENDLNQLLAHDGALVVISLRFLKLSHSVVPWRNIGVLHRFYIFPLSRVEYLVVGKMWRRIGDSPFNSLPLGMLSTIRKYMIMVMLRAGLVRIVNCITVDVCCHRSRNPVVTEIAGECGYGKIHESNVGLFAKAGWNAILLNPAIFRSIIKMPLASFNIDRMAKSAATIRQLENEAPASIRSKIPKLYGDGEICGQKYWVESLCSGVPASRFSVRGRQKRRVLLEGCKFLTELHVGTKRETDIDANSFTNLLPGTQMDEISVEARRLSPDFSLDEIIRRIERVMCGRRLPLVRTHGDFWSGNVLVTASGCINAVLDWDASKELSWPVVDLLHFLAHQNKRKGYWYCGPTITGRLMQKRLRSWETRIVKSYFGSLNLPADLWVCFNAIYWLERISEWAQTNLNDVWYSEVWIRRNVIDTAPQILYHMRKYYG